MFIIQTGVALEMVNVEVHHQNKYNCTHNESHIG